MSEILRAVSIGELTVSHSPDEVLVAYGLGSCTAICLYDPTARLGGMAHSLLPKATDEDGVKDNPARFVDRAVPLLLRTLLRQGAERGRMKAWLCGGAQMLDAPGFSDHLNIGPRNVQSAEAALLAAGIRIHARETGGKSGRTVRLYIADGRVTVRSIGQPEKFLP